MDNTGVFYTLNVGSIPARRTNGVVSVTVNTTDCDSVNTGSIPVRLPKQRTPHACHRQHTLGSFFMLARLGSQRGFINLLAPD